MNSGIEIQNWANRIGRRLGSKWRQNSRHRETPLARACSRKSELTSVRVPARMMRAGAAQPRHPSSRNVIITDVTGEVLSGNKARTASNRNSQGSERNRSMPAVTKRSQRPPR